MNYTAYVTYRAWVDGELIERTVAQDVTDCVVDAGGPDSETFEQLADRLYWHEVHGTDGFVDVIGGGVREEVAA